MTSRGVWLLRQLTRRMWFRASLFSVLAAITALVAIALAPYIPDDLPTKIGSDAVDNILGIIASSMLAVTTFSLSTMVAAYAAATSSVTPRATRLVMEDSTTQNVLSTFIGSFLFSVVGIIALSTGAYGERGRVVLFAVTILVIVAIVVTLLRWIDHLSRLGRVIETTGRVERAATAAMQARHQSPHLGCHPLRDRNAVPAGAVPVCPTIIGYVQHLDTATLRELTERDASGEIYVGAIPGDFVHPARPLAWRVGLGQDDEARICECFTIGETRSFDQDPRFGASVLAEIASRALSPGINDPGTAIDVIGRAVRLVAVCRQTGAPAPPEVHARVFVPGIDTGDLFDDLFTPIARDGAGLVEVGLRLQKALDTLSRLDPATFHVHAMRHSRLALERAEQAVTIEDDRQRLRGAAPCLRA